MAAPSDRPMPGGPLALDLANTAWIDGANVVDWLDDPQAVKAFVDEHGGQVSADEIDAVRVALVRSRRLIRDLFDTADAGSRAEGAKVANVPTGDDLLLTDINAELAHVNPTVTHSPAGVQIGYIHRDSTSLLATNALINALELLAEESHRIRSCGDENCVLWFHDTSKAGRRRWCSMDRCGNRAKAKRHYANARRP